MFFGNLKKTESLYSRNLAELCTTVMWKAQLVYNKPGFFLMLIVKCKSRDKFREELLKRNLDLLICATVSLSTLQDTKIRGFTQEKCALEKRANEW